MIVIRSGEGKKALARVLGDLHPESVEDLKMFAQAFGPLSEVAWSLDDPAADRALQERMEEERARSLDAGKRRAQEAIEKAKQLVR